LSFLVVSEITEKKGNLGDSDFGTLRLGRRFQSTNGSICQFYG